MNLINRYIKILKGKTCSRKDFWSYYIMMWCVFILIFIIGFIFRNYSHGLNNDFYFTFYGIIVFILSVVCFLLKIKRLRDANLSPWILLIYLLGLLGTSFNYLISIIMFAILCLPTQKIPTTNLRRNGE